MGVQINEDRWGVVTKTINPASVTNNITALQTFQLPGLTPDMIVEAIKPTTTAGLAVTKAIVTANNTLGIEFTNVTAAPIDPGSESYKIKWHKPEKTSTTVDT